MAGEKDDFWSYAWETYKDEIVTHGFYRIRIKPDFLALKKKYNIGMDNRVLAKMDHASDRPAVFKKNNLSLISVSNNDYIISHANSYMDIENISGDVKKVQVDDPNELLDPFMYSTEKDAITIAYNLGIFEDFVGDGTLNISVSGRFGHRPKERGVGRFTASTAKGVPFEIGDSQMEVDASYESSNFVIIVESNDANKAIPEDFNLRQLYYPLVDFRSRGVKKQIKLIYMAGNHQVFTLFEYRVVDENDINSFELVKKREYVLQK